MAKRRPVEPGDGPDPVEVVRVAYPALLVTARRLGAETARAEDLVQEAFVDTLSRHPGFEGLRHPAGYLHTVLFRAVARQRRSRVEPPIDLQERLEQPQPDLDAPMMVMHALRALGPRQRACLALRYLFDFTNDEIAATLGCRPSTVRSQVARGLAKARLEVEDVHGS